MGYFIEASINYPGELHEANNNYPIAPERLDVQWEMLSVNQVDLRTLFKMSRSAQSTKLIIHLFPKCKYPKLRFYLEQGIQFLDGHRVLPFQESLCRSVFRAELVFARSCEERLRKRDFEAEDQLAIRENI